MMRKILHKVLTRAGKRLAYAGITWPFVFLLARRLQASNATDAPQGEQKKYTILALSPERFRSDLELLETAGHIRVLRLPTNWQRGILGFFWEGRVEKSIVMNHQYLRDDIPDWIKRRRSASRRFLQALLKQLCARLEIDAVITAAIWYPQDYDWAFAAEQTGAPYISLHKENLAAGAGHRALMKSLVSKTGRFFGTSLIVQNEDMRQLFIETGVVEPENVHALGALRMDKYVDRISGPRAAGSTKSRQQVLFFSFERGFLDLFPADQDAGMPKFFNEAHVTIGRLAQSRPDVDFIIKPKYGGVWEREIVRALRGAGIEHETIPNLHIVVEGDVHQMILNADVICSYGSTTLLEAGIAGKPLIMPCFAEAREDSNRDYIQFRGRDDLFDIAASADNLIAKIQHYLDDPTLAPGRLDACRAEFEKLVSPLDGGAVAAYTQCIANAVEERREHTGTMPDSAEPRNAASR
jgi:hypothetical protein